MVPEIRIASRVRRIGLSAVLVLHFVFSRTIRPRPNIKRNADRSNPSGVWDIFKTYIGPEELLNLQIQFLPLLQHDMVWP